MARCNGSSLASDAFIPSEPFDVAQGKLRESRDLQLRERNGSLADFYR